jgi:hypothetical protein
MGFAGKHASEEQIVSFLSPTQPLGSTRQASLSSTKADLSSTERFHS